jgi:hypothetical protein
VGSIILLCREVLVLQQCGAEGHSVVWQL